MEPAIRIERTTCGLRIFPNTNSDNLTPQETTTQAAAQVGADGAGLSCPGSSVVAKFEDEAMRFEISTALETIGRDLTLSVRNQPLPQESEVDETPMKPDRPR
jgi:hypothetical protein